MKFRESHVLYFLISFYCVLSFSSVLKECHAKNTPTLCTTKSMKTLLLSKKELDVKAQVSNVKSKNAITSAYKLMAIFKKNIVLTGESIPLSIVLKNRSSEDMFIIYCNVFGDSKIEVKDERGRNIPLSEKGKQNIGLSSVCGSMAIQISPGEKYEYEIDLDELYNLSEGTYTVTVSRPILKKDEKTVVNLKAEPIKITVRK